MHFVYKTNSFSSMCRENNVSKLFPNVLQRYPTSPHPQVRKRGGILLGGNTPSATTQTHKTRETTCTGTNSSKKGMNSFFFLIT